MTITEYQQKVHDWILKHGVRYFDESTNMMLLMEEVGELSRLMARKYGEQSFKKDAKKLSLDADIGDELADVLFVLTCLANQMNIDLNDVIEQNFNKKNSRDQSRHKENPKLK